MDSIGFWPIFFVVATILLYILSVPLVYRYWKEAKENTPECCKKK